MKVRNVRNSMLARSDSPVIEAPPQERFFARLLFASNHKTVGLRYLGLALFSGLLGMILSLAMRLHLAGGGPSYLPAGWFDPARYGALVVFHGSLMVFFVLTAAPQFGFGYYFLPLQIGAREMAFPRLSLASFWSVFAALAAMTASFFAGDHGPTIWLCAATLFCAAALMSAVNFCVTAIDLRAPGVALTRLPLTVWSWFVTAILSLLIFSTLLAASALLLCDRFASTGFLSAASSAASPSIVRGTLTGVWQRWFWFFAQAEVYVAILPCFGLVSHLLAIFCRRPVWKERMAVLGLCGVGVFGFCVWGFHMFSSGLSPYRPLDFSRLAASLGIPAVLLVASWLGTLWKSSPRFDTPMLFALGFVVLFLSGGFTGVFLSNTRLAAGVSSDLITGHFHLVMGVAATFAILAALFFWFPKIFNRGLNERLGKVHFWLTIVGVYCIFVPAPWIGLLHSARAAEAAGSSVSALPLALSVQKFVAAAAFATIGAQFLFLLNLGWSLARDERARRNPWKATTLEWFVSSPPPAANFGTAPNVYRGAYEIGAAFAGVDFVPQHLAPEFVQKHR